MGYNVTAVNVSESDGVAQMTVTISMPPGADAIETFFSLMVNTLNGTATGLAKNLEFDNAPIHSVTNESLAA